MTVSASPVPFNGNLYTFTTGGDSKPANVGHTTAFTWWQCATCQQWCMLGSTHVCQGYVPASIPAVSTANPFSNDARIAAALEKIASALEALLAHTNKRDGIH